MARHLWLLFGEAGENLLPGLRYACGAGAFGCMEDVSPVVPFDAPVDVLVVSQAPQDDTRPHSSADALMAQYEAFRAFAAADDASLPPIPCRVQTCSLPVPAGTMADLVGMGSLTRQGFQATYGLDALEVSAAAAMQQHAALSLLQWCRQWQSADFPLTAALQQTLPATQPPSEQSDADQIAATQPEMDGLQVFLACAADDAFALTGALTTAAWLRKQFMAGGAAVALSLGVFLPGDPSQGTESSATALASLLHTQEDSKSAPLFRQVYPIGLPEGYTGTAESPFLQLLMLAAMQDSIQAREVGDSAYIRLLNHPGSTFSMDVLASGWGQAWQTFATQCMGCLLSSVRGQTADQADAREFATGYFQWLEAVATLMPAPFRLGNAMEAAAHNAAYSLRYLLGQVSVQALMEYDAAHSGMLEEAPVHRTAERRETAAEQMIRAIEERKESLVRAHAAMEKHWRLIGGAARLTVIQRAVHKVSAGWAEADRQRMALLEEVLRIPDENLPPSLQGSAAHSKLTRLEKHTLMLRAQMDACQTMLEEAQAHRHQQPELPGDVKFALCGLSSAEFANLQQIQTLPQGHRSREQAVLALRHWLSGQQHLETEAEKASSHPTKAYVPPVPMVPQDVQVGEGLMGGQLGFVSFPAEGLTFLEAHQGWEGDLSRIPYVTPLAICLSQGLSRAGDHDPIIAHWRGALAVALLFDGWKQDGLRMTLKTRDIPADSLQHNALTMMHPMEEAFTWVTLADVKETWVLGQADRQWGFLPMCPGSQSLLGLPSRITWMAPAHDRFLDPTSCLHPTDRGRLIRHLTILQGLDSLHPQVLRAITQWIDELTAAGRLPEEEAEQSVLFEDTLLRLAVVVGLSTEHGYEALTCQTDRFVQPTQANPLLSVLLDDRCPLPLRDNLAPLAPSVTYFWAGVPFARQSDTLGLASTGHHGEAAVLDSFSAQVEVLLHQSPQWQAALKQRLTQAISGGELTLSDGIRKRLIRRLALLEDLPLEAHLSSLDAPWDASSPAIHMLLDEQLGVQLGDNLLGDCLLLAEGEGLPYGFPVSLGGEELPIRALLPICEKWHPLLFPCMPDEVPALHILWETLTIESTQEDIQVTLVLEGKHRLQVTRRYDADACILVEEAALPTVSLEPVTRLPAHRWKRYTLRHQPRDGYAVDAWQLGKWTPLGMGETVVFAYPEWIRLSLLQEAQPVLGVMPLLQLLQPIGTIGSAAVGIDLGSTAVAAMVRIGAKVQPVVQQFDRACILGQSSQDGIQMDIGPQFDLSWAEDHALHPAALTLADVIGEEMPRHRDLMWTLSSSRLSVLSEYLEKLLLEAALCVVRLGGEDALWRISLPALLPQKRREEISSLLKPLVERVSEATGLPITYGNEPCLVAADVDVLGYLYRGEEQGGYRGSYLMLDIGGYGLTASLWLRGMSKRIEGFILPMGVRTLLMQWLIHHPDTLLEDRHILGEDQDDLKETETAIDMLRRSTGSLQSLEAAKGMVDALLGERVDSLARLMAVGLQFGEQTMLQGVILLYFSWVFAMVGQFLETASEDVLLSDRLPSQLILRLCGRGHLLLTTLSQSVQAQVHGFLRLPKITTNPIPVIEVEHSPFPKQEAATGIAMMTQVELTTDRAPYLVSAPRAYQRDMTEGLMTFMRAYLLHFATQFPESMDLLFPAWVTFAPRAILSDDAVQAVRRWAVSAAAQGKGELSWMECISTGLSFLIGDHG